MLNKAIEIAARAHAGQVDKGGLPYILHPLRIMLTRENEMERICAVLHDVIEDSVVSLDDLKKYAEASKRILDRLSLMD
jgi:(p)ppGpp synthase/HD superfamily hydrolase